MKVALTEPAERHLEAIETLLLASSTRSAQRFLSRLARRMEQIGDFPGSGRLVRRAEALEIREVFEGSYRIIYVVARDQVEVLGIIHARRDVL